MKPQKFNFLDGKLLRSASQQTETVGMKPVIGAFLPKLLKHSPVHLFTDGTDIIKLAAVSFPFVWIQTVRVSHTHTHPVHII